MRKILIVALALIAIPLFLLGMRTVARARRIDADETACRRGSSEACARGADALLANGSEAHDARAAAMLERACKKSNGDACSNLGYLVAYGRVGEGGVPEAVKLYAKGCDLDSLLGCGNLAAVLSEGGPGVDADVPRAVDAFEKACKLGDSEACDEAKELAKKAVPQPPAPEAAP